MPTGLSPPLLHSSAPHALPLLHSSAPPLLNSTPPLFLSSISTHPLLHSSAPLFLSSAPRLHALPCSSPSPLLRSSTAPPLHHSTHSSTHSQRPCNQCKHEPRGNCRLWWCTSLCLVSACMVTSFKHATQESHLASLRHLALSVACGDT